MYPQTLLLALSLASALALPTQPSKETLPWQITALNTHSSSGLPGNDAHSTLAVTVADPNWIDDVAGSPTGPVAFAPTSAKCDIRWLPGYEPWDAPQACVPQEQNGNAQWNVTMEPGVSGTRDFGLRFDLLDSVDVLGTVYSRRFTASAAFRVGKNLQWECGSSGACDAALVQVPFDLVQKEID